MIKKVGSPMTVNFVLNKKDSVKLDLKEGSKLRDCLKKMNINVDEDEDDKKKKNLTFKTK
ncbi:MAG: hypothetical protein WC783_00105 [Candidatus Paceibacterota bacterium]|jgi:hypothetical protein